MWFFLDEPKLLLINQVKEVGKIPPTSGLVYCIERITIVPLSLDKTSDEIRIEVCVLFVFPH